jgi:predicted RNA binding protein YcfA (HicA-like mRNA interferase family)
MSDFPILSGKKLISILEKMNFQVIRIKGSHNFLKHPDGRSTVIPVHSNEDIGPGLLSKILKDCKITREEIREYL